MAAIRVGDAFSVGIGLALGLSMTQYMFQVMRPDERNVKQVVVCLYCGSKNSVENRFCGQCGRPFYVAALVKCKKCGSMMPSKMNFCGNCGLPLRKQREEKTEK